MKSKFTESRKKFAAWDIDKQSKFLGRLLFDMTIMNRSIWSNPELTMEQKVDCLKWSNELSHRIWGIVFEIENNDSRKVEERLFENVKFYGDQSVELEKELDAFLKSSFENFD